MMTMETGWDSLLGQIAVERGLLTGRQLAKVLKEISPRKTAQKGPSKRKPLGVTLVAKGLVSDKDLIGLLEEQSRRMQVLESFRVMRKREFLIGQLLVKYNKATQNQINKCLELQQDMAEKGENPIPRMGELLISYGYVDQRTLDETLAIQNEGKETASGINRPAEEK